MAGVDSRAYRKGHLVDQGFGVDAIAAHLDDPDVVLWLDLDAPSREELEAMCGPLDLHELSVHNAAEPHQRPKVDHYDGHLFVACNAVSLVEGRGLETTEVDVFLGDRWLVTVRKGDGFPVVRLRQEWDSSPDFVARGPAYLLYDLLDTVADGYDEVVQRFDDFYEEVSDRIFTERPVELGKQRRWFEMRRELYRFHRLAVQAREATSSLLRRQHATIEASLYPYYQDVHDHLVVVTESTDALRDLVGTIVDTNVALRDIQLNQIMKKLTGWAAIIAMPALVTGYYGMNVPFPGSGRAWGVVAASALVVILSGLLYGLFRRKDWL